MQKLCVLAQADGAGGGSAAMRPAGARNAGQPGRGTRGAAKRNGSSAEFVGKLKPVSADFSPSAAQFDGVAERQTCRPALGAPVYRHSSQSNQRNTAAGRG